MMLNRQFGVLMFLIDAITELIYNKQCQRLTGLFVPATRCSRVVVVVVLFVNGAVVDDDFSNCCLMKP